MHREHASVGRRARDRKAATSAARQDEVDVLARAKTQVLDRRQLEEHRHHVVGEPLHAVDAAWQVADFDLGRWTDLARLDRDVLERVRLAQQCVASFGFARRDASRQPSFGILDITRENASATGRAVSAFTTVRQVQPRSQRRGQHGLARGGREALACGDEGDPGHGS